MLKKRLPPLEPLIAFEAAARLLSFTRAGEERTRVESEQREARCASVDERIR